MKLDSFESFIEHELDMRGVGDTAYQAMLPEVKQAMTISLSKLGEARDEIGLISYQGGICMADLITELLVFNIKAIADRNGRPREENINRLMRSIVLQILMVDRFLAQNYYFAEDDGLDESDALHE